MSKVSRHKAPDRFRLVSEQAVLGIKKKKDQAIASLAWATFIGRGDVFLHLPSNQPTDVLKLVFKQYLLTLWFIPVDDQTMLKLDQFLDDLKDDFG